jgi:hypothetical protein
VSLIQTLKSSASMGRQLMNDEFKKRLSDARTRLQGAKDKANQAAAGALADADRRLTGLHSAVSLWNGVKAPLIKQVVEAANQELADIGVRLDASDLSSFAPTDTDLPGIKITIERLLVPGLQQMRGRDPGSLSLQGVTQAASVTIALNHDGAVSIIPNNCSLSEKGVIPLYQFAERQIETIVADFVDQLTRAAAT